MSATPRDQNEEEGYTRGLLPEEQRELDRALRAGTVREAAFQRSRLASPAGGLLRAGRSGVHSEARAFHESSVYGMPELAKELGWDASEFCYLDPDWGKHSQFVINKAMSQINNNIHIVESFFDKYRTSSGGKLSGNCVVNLLTASTWTAGFLHFAKGDRNHACGGVGSNIGWNACTLPGAVVITLAKQYVKAVFNTRSDFACGSGSIGGACECIIAQLAGTIAHETCHSCLLDEIPAHLLAAHYKATFAAEQGNTSSRCCGTLPFSYKESKWTKASAAAASNVTDPQKGTDGKLRLTSC